VPGFGSPAPVVDTSGGDAWWNSEWVPDNDVVPRFGEGEVPGFGNGGGGFGGRSGSVSGFMASGGGRPNDTSM